MHIWYGILYIFDRLLRVGIGFTAMLYIVVCYKNLKYTSFVLRAFGSIWAHILYYSQNKIILIHKGKNNIQNIV